MRFSAFLSRFHVPAILLAACALWLGLGQAHGKTADEIDRNRAKQLRQRMLAGEKLTQEEREYLARAAKERRAKAEAAGESPPPAKPPVGPPTDSAADTAWIAVLPVAAIVGQDVFLGNYFDRSPAKGTFRDYMGGKTSYDGHEGTDFSLGGFALMDVGVPVVAVLKGTVIKAVDGYLDRETERKEGRPSNLVVIDHGEGRKSSYFHLRRDSIRVKRGQQVETGEQLGLVGSSGDSAGPHLHFECIENRKCIDPFAAPSGSGRTRWLTKQPDYQNAPRVRNAVFVRTEPPYWCPTAGLAFLGVGTGTVNCAIYVVNEHSGTERFWQLLSPDGIEHSSHRHRSPEDAFCCPLWFEIDTSSLRPGRWTVRVSQGKMRVAEVPVDVTSGRPPPKHPVPRSLKATLWPRHPAPSEAVRCDLAAITPTFDPREVVPRYRYTWSLDGESTRVTVSPTHCDYFPAGKARAGSRLVCEVSTAFGSRWTSAASAELLYSGEKGGRSQPMAEPAGKARAEKAPDAPHQAN